MIPESRYRTRTVLWRARQVKADEPGHDDDVRNHTPMTDTLKPRDDKEVVEAVAWAAAEAKTLEVVGRGTKRAVGRAAQTDLTLDGSGISGIVLYEPEELVLSAKAGTPLVEIEKALVQNRQEFSFRARRPRPAARRQGGRGLNRRHVCCQSLGPAPHQGGGGARPRARRQSRFRPRRSLQGQRPRGEERHRLRSAETARRFLGHARGDDRDHVESAAGGGGCGDRARARPRATSRRSRR